MMYTLREREGTCTFHKIMRGRKWIGRVAQHADGTWIGVIGKLMVSGHGSPRDAFGEVVAQHLGYEGESALRDRNARVRQARRDANAAADALAADALAGDFSRIDKLGPEGLLLALGGINRSMRVRRRRR